MNRAMFSGVAGLKTHQTKMDVIGNNIANVNTYGYKAQRAVFSDIYYQTLRSASAGTANRGGTNPSSVGYGSSLAAIQTQITQSSMQNTGFGLDVAITGEGFLQVMDPDGNIFYTKAGLLDYDSNGYLTDINGNFVLGSTAQDGAPGTQKIKLDNIGAVDPKRPSVTEEINGISYTITASNTTPYGNVGLTISASEDLPAGLKAVATIASTGAITVQLNAFEEFSSMSELNSVINAAILEANGGQPHAAGTFTITASENVFGRDATNGTWTGRALAENPSIKMGTNFFDGRLEISSFNPARPYNTIADNGAVAFKVTNVDAAANSYTIEATVDGKTYTGTVLGTALPNSKVTLTEAGGGTVELNVVSNGGALGNVLQTALDNAQEYAGTVSSAKQFMGGASITAISENFTGQGNITFTVASNAAGDQWEITATTANGKAYTGSISKANGGTVILETVDGADIDGTITMSIPNQATMATNLGLTAADDPTTALQASLGHHTYVAVPYQAGESAPLTGAQIAGENFGVTLGTITGLEDGAFDGGMTFIKTSSDFSGSGTVENLYATYHVSPEGKPYFTVTLGINGVHYDTDIYEDTVATSVLLKGPDGDYVQMTNPGFDAIRQRFERENATEPLEGGTVSGVNGDVLAQLKVTPSTPSRDLGFSTVGFTLTGGTEGGTITLDELTSIAIGADGTVSVSHPEKGTVVAGKISLANFANPSGLLLSGNNYFTATVNSGDPVLCDPGTGGTGALKNSSLEMSNVDLSNEFADMITTQRGFQANSRVITVSDTMLEELINLKR